MSIPDAEQDAELLALGRELAVWRAAEKAAGQVADECLSDAADAAAEVISDMGSAVAAKIVALRATTLAGVRVKAQAAAFFHGEDDFDLGDDVSGDVAAAASVVADLLRMGETEAPLPV